MEFLSDVVCAALSRTTRFRATFLLAAGASICATLGAPAGNDSSYIKITSPRPRTIITTNSIPIEADVHVPGEPLRYVHFQVNHITAGFNESDSLRNYQGVLHVLGRDSVPPYRTIWDISSIQDHSHGRMIIVSYAVSYNNNTVATAFSDFVVDRNPKLARDLVLHAPRHGRPKGAGFTNSDNTIEVVPQWDRDSLYFSVSVHDSRIVTRRKHEADTGDIAYWFEDDIEIFLDPHNAKSPLHDSSCVQLVLSPEGGAFRLWLAPTGKNRRPLSAQISLSDTGYIAQCAVAWTTLGLTPHRGLRIGLDIANYDRDSPDGLISLGTWAGLTLANHHNASEWGTLVLAGGMPASALALIGLGVAAVAGLGGVLVWGRRRKRSPAVSTAVPQDALDLSKAGAITRAVVDAVEEEYSNDACNLEYIAARIDRYPKYVSTVFRRETGLRFTEYLNKRRLAAARHLLLTTDQPAADISLQVGYANYSYFVRLFRRHFGCTPSEVRTQNG